MAEHTPTPSIGRAFYGFAVYLIGWAAIILYVGWALVPHSFLKNIGITYLPQPYWALAIPSLLLTTLFLFVFCIYPSINLMLCVPPNDIRTLKDCQSVDKSSYTELDKCSVPPIYDIPISYICRNVYLEE